MSKSVRRVHSPHIFMVIATVLVLVFMVWVITLAIDSSSEPPTRIQVCEFAPDRKLIVIINEDDFNKSIYSKDLEDCR